MNPFGWIILISLMLTGIGCVIALVIVLSFVIMIIREFIAIKASRKECEEVRREHARRTRFQAEFQKESSRKPTPVRADPNLITLGLTQYPRSRQELRDAYVRMIKRVHPDHGGSTETTIRVNQAYATLQARYPA